MASHSSSEAKAAAAAAAKAAKKRREIFQRQYNIIGQQLQSILSMPMHGQIVKAYTKAIGVNSRHVDAHFNLGVLHHTLEKVELAIPSYEKAIRIDPTHHDALSNLGSARHKTGDYDGAIRAYEKAIAIVQGLDSSQVDSSMLSMLYYLLGSAVSSQPDTKCKGMPCAELAALKVREALRINPENTEARVALNSMITDPNVTETSQAVVKKLYEEFEDEYDSLQLNGHAYQVPSLLRAALEELSAQRREGAKFQLALDAGCGLGACGQQIRNLTETLVGFDLEAKMVEKASQKNIYDEVVEQDVTKGLGKFTDKDQKNFNKKLNLIIAGDLLVHFSDLDTVFGHVANGLTKGGWFAFTVESLNASEVVERPADSAGADADTGIKAETDDEKEGNRFSVLKGDIAKGFKMRPTGRYAHTREYIASVAAKYNFKLLAHKDVVPRSDGVNDVQGQLVVAELIK